VTATTNVFVEIIFFITAVAVWCLVLLLWKVLRKLLWKQRSSVPPAPTDTGDLTAPQGEAAEFTRRDVEWEVRRAVHIAKYGEKSLLFPNRSRRTGPDDPIVQQILRDYNDDPLFVALRRDPNDPILHDLLQKKVNAIVRHSTGATPKQGSGDSSGESQGWPKGELPDWSWLDEPGNEADKECLQQSIAAWDTRYAPQSPAAPTDTGDLTALPGKECESKKGLRPPKTRREISGAEMNKAQKILTVVALVIFCVIVVLCYVPSNNWVIDTPVRYYRSGGFRPGRGHYGMMIDNPALPILTLAVLYAGVMMLLKSNSNRKRPQILQKLGPPKFRPPTPDAAPLPPRKLSPEEEAAQAEWLAEEDAKWDAQIYHDPWEGRP
jgi:hypothetical protein